MPAYGWDTPQWHTKAEDMAQEFASDIKGKTILITGVSPDSLGAYFAATIHPHGPALLILASRSLSKLEAVQSDLKARFPTAKIRLLQLDLSDFDQVRAAAAELNSWSDIPAIDVLLNNAGVAGTGERKIVRGIEQQFLVNHLGHFLLTSLVLPKVIAAAQGRGEARIVNVSSRGHLFSPVLFDDINLDGVEPDKAALTGYGQSKTANILFTVALAEKLEGTGVKSYSLHPGSIWTGLVRDMTIEELVSRGWADENRRPTDSEKMKWKSISEGTSTHVVACFDPSIAGHNGAYLQDAQIETEDVKDYALDLGNAERLWKLSEELVGNAFNLGN